ncbi:MAG: glycosyltransferase family 4 protein [Candidatus Promineifilaceae bacterium]
MRILHLVHQYLPEKIGGTELYTRALAQRQAAAGHDVSIFSPSVTAKNWPEPTLEGGVWVYRRPLGQRSPAAVFQATFRQPDITEAFQRLLEKTQPDLVHIQHLMGLPVSLVNVLKANAVPYVITLHDYWYICANAQLLTNYDSTICDGPNWWLNCAHCALARAGKETLAFLRPAVAPLMAFRNFRLKAALDQASRLIAPTHFVRETYDQLGIAPEKIIVIPHGIQPPENGRSPQPKETNVLRVVYIGGLAPQKGVHILVEAINDLAEGLAALKIYGDMSAFPEYVAALQAQVHRLNIQFYGRLPHEALWDVLAQSDVVVVPSLWYETASLIIQEAFAAGVPVIASDIGALRERVRDGVNGFLFPPGDAAVLSRLLADLSRYPDKLAQLTAQIQPVYTIDQHQQAVEETYQLVLSQSSAV